MSQENEHIVKSKRKKRFWMRKLVKEVRRVRWPDAKTNSINFVKILIFTVIFTIFVTALSFGFTHLFKLWNI
ncbi:preprotein translocase subunit SecE [Mycoplasma sp. 394]